MLNVLIGGECSGIIRDAFRARGHNAWSCDLKDAEVPAPSGASLGHIYHLKGDVRRVLGGVIPDDMVEFSTWRGGHKPIFIGWDLAIFHPDCSRLCNSGALRLYIAGKKGNGPDEKRWAEMREAAAFFRALHDAPIPKVAVENPIMHGHATREHGCGAPTQIIQPHEHGEDASKATGLWLRNLPPLTETATVAPRMVEGRPRWANQTDSGQNRLAPSETRSVDRARTYPGIAAAMADQWGCL